MSLQSTCSNLFLNKTVAFSLPPLHFSSSSSSSSSCKLSNYCTKKEVRLLVQATIDRSISSGSSKNNDNSSKNGDGSKKGVPNSNYVVPLDKSFSLNYSCMTRPLVEILRDLNKRIPDNIVTSSPYSHASPTYIHWYHANRMLSFYAPGWCGEIRDVIFSENGGVTVVYRVTIRGSDGEAFRESSGTVSSSDSHIVDPVAAAEEIAFCKACAKFGLGLYLYHEE